MKLGLAVLVVALALAASGVVGQEAPAPAHFPHLAAAPLDSPAWITGRLGELDPESEADAPERELLLRLLDYLEAHPQLTRSALLALRRDLRSRVTAAEAAFDSAAEGARDAAAPDVVEAQADVELLEDLLLALRRHAVAAAPAPSPDEDVARLGGPGAQAAAARLALLLPFLDPEAAAAVQAALAAWREDAPPGRGTAAAAGSPETDRLAELTQEASAAEAELRAARHEDEVRREAMADVWTAAQKGSNDSSLIAAEIAARPVQLRDANRRQADAEALYADLRRLVEGLRVEVAEAGGKRIAAEKDWAATRAAAADARRRLEHWRELAAAGADAPGPEGAQESPAALERWERALEERLRLGEERLALEERHRDRMFVLLKDTKTMRRDLEAVVPAAARRADRQYLIADVTSEAHLILPLVEALARQRARTLAELPSKWRDWTLLGELLSGLLRFLLIAALWWAARRIARRTAPALLRLWASRSERYVPPDLWAMSAPAVRTLTSLVDLGAMGLILGPVREALPELGLVLLVALQVALYRLILGFASLAVAIHPAVRPSLVTLEPAARKLAMRTVRVAVLWLIARQFLRYAALEILSAVTLHEVLGLAFDVLLAVLAVWAFHVWEPFLRDALLRRDPLHPLVAFQTRRELRLLRAFQAVAHAALYAYLWARDLLAGLGDWSSILDPFKRPAADADDDRPPELPGEVVKLLLSRACPERGRLERTRARAQLDERFRRWLASRRRGVAVVLGDEGMGKHDFVDTWCRSVGPGADGDASPEEDADRCQVVRLVLRERLTSAADARRWLAASFRLDAPPAEPRAVAGRLSAEAARRVVVVEDLQFAFLRRVDGFAALNYLLSVVGSASDQALWVFTLHSPAWRYLASLGGLVHTEVFRTVVVLRPFDEKELRWIIERRLAAAGHRADFTPLMPAGARLRPNPLALERVTTEYFRRLAWISQGNPTVALRLWRETLAADGRAGVLSVCRYCQSAVLPGLRDADLFLLAAVRTHRSLTEPELVEVTNMSPALVSAALKHLEGRRLLTTRSKRFSIEPRHLPAVNTDLRRRHFLHGSA